MASVYNIFCTYHEQFGQSDTLPHKASDTSHHLAPVKVHWRDLEAAHSSCDRKFDSHTFRLWRGWAVGVGGGQALLAYLRMNLVEARDLVIIGWSHESLISAQCTKAASCLQASWWRRGTSFSCLYFRYCTMDIKQSKTAYLLVQSPETLQKYSFRLCIYLIQATHIIHMIMVLVKTMISG